MRFRLTTLPCFLSSHFLRLSYEFICPTFSESRPLTKHSQPCRQGARSFIRNGLRKFPCSYRFLSFALVLPPSENGCERGIGPAVDAYDGYQQDQRSIFLASPWVSHQCQYTNFAGRVKQFLIQVSVKRCVFSINHKGSQRAATMASQSVPLSYSTVLYSSITMRCWESGSFWTKEMYLKFLPASEWRRRGIRTDQIGVEDITF